MKPRFEKCALEHREQFRGALGDWFRRDGKDYPWRRTRDAYAILVSEVMLQQTQIGTVLGRGYYERFLESFPDLESLARADDESLLKAWEGLGYYRRVRMLRATAQAVIAEFEGQFPTQLESLMALPGVGRYTAGALRAFAFDLPAALVDGNVARVFARIMDFTEPVNDGAGQRQMWEWAEALADDKNPRVYNSALMELGQSICRPSVPNCLGCPVVGFCKSREPEMVPKKVPRMATTTVDEHALWLRDSEGRLLVHCEAGKRRQGLWKLPTREAADVIDLPMLAEECYTITRYRVNLRVYDGKGLRKFPLGEGEVWKTSEAVLQLAMPSPFRRVIGRLMVEF